MKFTNIKESFAKHYMLYKAGLYLAVLLYLAVSLVTSGYIYNLIPSEANNYVFIMGSETYFSDTEKVKPVRVEITDGITHRSVSAEIKSYEEYGYEYFWVTLLKQGVYNVTIYYSQLQPSQELKLRIVPGKEVYIIRCDR